MSGLRLSVVGCQKQGLRAWAKNALAACDPAAGGAMAAGVLAACLPAAGAVVGGFWPLPGEIDTRPLLLALAARGFAVGLPETPVSAGPLVFRGWAPGDVLVAGRFGTRVSRGAVLRPDFLLVPFLAFDARGNRLGHGGGFYDRTLATLPDAFRLGCGFAAREVADVPVEATDMPLHAVATERGVRRF